MAAARSRLPFLTLIFVAGLLSGCATNFGPRTVLSARFSYSEAISKSWDEQLLLNLVRLRYRDNPLFVDVTSVTASYSQQADVSLGITEVRGSSRELSAGIGGAYENNPIISYSYLTGEQFTRGLLSPITPEALRELAYSGWSIERLLLCCVQSLNGVPNAPSAAGPTPDEAPRYEEFHRIARLMRILQARLELTPVITPVGMSASFSTTTSPESAELRRLLGVDPEAERVVFVAGRERLNGDEVAVQTRSLLSVMFFLSHAIEVPEIHRRSGKVTITTDIAGGEFDWTRVLGPLLHIRSSLTKPPEAAVQVQVRGHWFWIDDSDLNAKTTFALLRLLLFLKSGEQHTTAPLVTIPTR